MQKRPVSPSSVRLTAFAHEFRVPGTIVLGILAYLALQASGQTTAALVVAMSVTLIGSWELLAETVTLLLKRQYALDYIAVLAIAVGLWAGEYIVAMIIALMVSSGRTLEEYGVARAKRSLDRAGRPHSI